MSRSKRLPFSDIAGVFSSRPDKTLAHRGIRRAHRRAIHIAYDFENFILPHKRECAWNNLNWWRRHGSKVSYFDWQFDDDAEHLAYYHEIIRK